MKLKPVMNNLKAKAVNCVMAGLDTANANYCVVATGWQIGFYFVLLTSLLFALCWQAGEIYAIKEQARQLDAQLAVCETDRYLQPLIEQGKQVQLKQQKIEDFITATDIPACANM